MDPYISFEGDSNRVAMDVRDALQAAFHEKGLEFPSESRSGFTNENITIQKLVYRVVEQHNLPLIRTWYRYGQFEPYPVLKPSRMSAKPLRNPEKKVPTGNDPMGISLREIKGYFLEEDLEADWNLPLFQFLKENYERWAEDNRDLYLANLEVLRSLEGLQQEKNLVKNAEKYAESLKRPSMDLQYHLQSNPLFDELVEDHVRIFLDELQSALISLSAKSSPRPVQTQAVRRAYRVYHDYIWPLPAMEISVHAAQGPDSEIEEFSEKGEEYANDYREMYPKRRKEWCNEIVDADLRPTPSVYQKHSGRISPEFGKLEEASLFSPFDE